MRSVVVVVAIAASGGCKKPEPLSTTASKEVTGTFSVGGKPVVVTACKPGRGFGTYVELVSAAGKLRFEDKSLYWTSDPKTILRGDRAECGKLDRSWGGGSRLDGSSYFRGKLIFDCTAGATTLTGDLQVDCGNITAEERAGLDKNSAELKAQQKQWAGGSGSGSAAALASSAACKRLLEHLVDLEFAKAAASSGTRATAEQRAAVIDAKSAEFVAECTKTTAMRVDCALAATDLESIEVCDRPE